MWTMLGAQLLTAGLSNEAVAREYALNPAASGVLVDETLRIDPIEIDATQPDFVLVVRFRNDGQVPLVMQTSSMRCLKGDAEFPVGHGQFGIGERWLDLMPGESKTLQLLCDHGSTANGDFGLVIPAVHVNPNGDGRTMGEPLVTELVWRLREADVTRAAQTSGEQLACVSYRRPPPAAAPAPIVVAAPAAPIRPLAIPGNEPPPPPHAAAPPPPRPPAPAASLRPR